MTFDKIIELLKSDDYKSRAIGEYWLVKDKYNKLHSAIVKREAGKLNFKPKCSMELWKAQEKTMGQYLYQLEVKAEIEGYSLDEVKDESPISTSVSSYTPSSSSNTYSNYENAIFNGEANR